MLKSLSGFHIKQPSNNKKLQNSRKARGQTDGQKCDKMIMENVNKAKNVRKVAKSSKIKEENENVKRNDAGDKTHQNIKKDGDKMGRKNDVKTNIGTVVYQANNLSIIYTEIKDDIKLVKANPQEYEMQKLNLAKYDNNTMFTKNKTLKEAHITAKHLDEVFKNNKLHRVQNLDTFRTVIDDDDYQGKELQKLTKGENLRKIKVSNNLRKVHVELEKMNNIVEKLEEMDRNQKFALDIVQLIMTKSVEESEKKSERLKILKTTVDKAKRERKTFAVVNNCCEIRNALLDRDWIEIMQPSFLQPNYESLLTLQTKTVEELLPYLNDKLLAKDVEILIMSKLLNGHQVDFYWELSFKGYEKYCDDKKFTLINSVKRKSFHFLSKQALTVALKFSHWYNNPDGLNYVHPRSYILTNMGEPRTFIEDYKITSVISLLKWVICQSETCSTNFISPNGTVPIKIFQFALRESMKYLKKCRHIDVDLPIDIAGDDEWTEFFKYFNVLTFGDASFKGKGIHGEVMVESCKEFMLAIEKYRPSLASDGVMNIWILKPCFFNMGVGIYLCNSLKQILDITNENSDKHYVIQKYIGE